MRFGSVTDKGLIRLRNEDSYHIFSNDGQFPLVFILADGMGGHKMGELASKLAVEYVTERLQDSMENMNSIPRIKYILQDISEKANVKVYLESLAANENTGMGTTLTVGVIYDDTLIVSHVGDCRLYVLRKNQLMRITVDHTLIQELIDSGRITPSQGMVHPKRHILTKALGVPEYLSPDIYVLGLNKNDKILMSSDGLHGYVPDNIIKTILKRRNDPAEIAHMLVERALKTGGEDNVTVIVGEYS